MPGGAKGSRAAYSRLICLGCRERRIRCELPSEVEIPGPGELKTVQTPCYRCKKLNVPCVVRQTLLGRPGHDSKPNPRAQARLVRACDVFSQVIIELPSRPAVHTQSEDEPYETRVINSSVVPHTRLDPLLRQEDLVRWSNGNTLLYHTPLSTETVVIIRSLDIIRLQKVEKEWFRHLPARIGNSHALDLSCKAMVAACAYARGEPKLAIDDCYRAVALAVNAVRLNFKQSPGGHFDDDMLACTALLAHLEGVIKKHAIPTRLHIQGLAAILAARPPTYPVTQLARQIFDFHICDAAIMACIQGTASPFETIPRAYYENDRRGCSDSDRAELKALGSELFIRIPRLVRLVRSIRSENQPLIDDAFTLLKPLLSLQDPQAEARLLEKTVTVRSSSHIDSKSTLLRESLQFACIDDFEALMYYWQNRLSLLRLEQRLHSLSAASSSVQATFHSRLSSNTPRTKEIFRLAKNILMSVEYFATLPLRKHQRLSAHAMVAVWGAHTDCSLAFSNMQDSTETSVLVELLLRRVSALLGAATKPDSSTVANVDSPLTVRDMDMAADMFVGGPLRGRFIELYCRAS
jgi:hypothetical protein